jgi:DNA/RNA-binding domain of Phe-tRNA-synthetase-like protein
VLTYTPEFAAAYEGCYVGALSVRFEAPPPFTDALERELAARGSSLSERYGSYSRAELKALPVIADYVKHFKRFKKSYHVLLQLASAAEGKPLPRVSPLVSIMLASELQTFVLSSGHDLEVVSTPLTFDTGSSGREIELLGGRTQSLKDGDITLRDGETTLAAVVYGQSRHGMLKDESTTAAFVAYGVPGIEEAALRSHLEDMAEMVRLCGGNPQVEQPELLRVG